MDQPRVDFKDRSADIKGRMRAFLAFTVSSYTSGTRATVKDKHGLRVCVYGATESSTGCAIGQHCSPKGVASRFSGAITKLLDAHPRAIPAWMRDFDIRFLRDVQLLHDHSINWNATGLSPRGRSLAVDTIERRIASPIYYTAGASVLDRALL